MTTNLSHHIAAIRRRLQPFSCLFIGMALFFSSFSPLHAASTAKPWTFWYWMYGAVSKEGIRADLQSMKDVGLGGFYLMPIRSATEKPEYEGKAEQLTPAFWDMVGYAMQQADSLGLEMGVHICDGFALAGGPWITPAESMQKIVYSDTIVTGTLAQLVRKGLTLSQPTAFNGYYEDIATYAIPLHAPVAVPTPDITLSPTMTLNARGVYSAAEPAWIQYDFHVPQQFRNVEIAANGTNMQAQRMRVEASDDGITFRTVKQLVPPRQGWQNYDYSTTFAFQPTTARYWRLSWTPAGTEPGSEDLDAAKWRPRLGLKGATFSNLPRIDSWEGKAGFLWRIAPATTAQELPDADCVPLSSVITLQLQGNQVTGFSGLPQSGAPSASAYRIVRLGHTSTGYTNATAGGGKGLECDKFSAAAVNKQVDEWFTRFAPDAPHAATPVKFLHVDSWECGGQNWSGNFLSEFRSRRGYDLLPYLPVMVGIPVESTAKSEEVLHDVRLTINDLIHEVFFATVRDRAHQAGMLFSSESVAPTMVSDGLLHYRYADAPMGEYWLNSPTHDKPNDMLDAISGAHVYGKPIVQAEGFTEVRGVWNETPAMVKPLLDRHFALGMNKLFFHVTTHNPWTDRRPGMTLDGIGLFFQRDNTWFGEAKGFVDYITRCQEILQSGRPVVDIAVFTGEEMPSRAVLPERLVPMLPGIFGADRVAHERQRLANEGQPMEESPVGVWHSAGITDSKDWVNALRGYHYDSMNRDALLRLATVEDGCIVLPGGARYRVLVMPQYNPQAHAPLSADNLSAAEANAIPAVYSAEVKAKVDAFRQAGVIVIDKPYTADDFSAFGLERDAVLPPHVGFTHIPLSGEGDVYFLTNQENHERTITASFRVKDRREVYLADAVSGQRLRAEQADLQEGRTTVTMTLPPFGSVFVELLQAGCPQANSTVAKTFKTVAPAAQASHSMAIQSPWQVSFAENQAAATVSLPDDWSRAEQPAIRYYSGKAAYQTTFTYPKKHYKEAAGKRVVLSLGEIHDIAHVYLNGKDCGIAWTAPYEVDITDAIQKGNNTLVIDVVNTWHNALKGADAGMPPYPGIWTNAPYRTKGDDLLPAGLVGPVEIRF